MYNRSWCFDIKVYIGVNKKTFITCPESHMFSHDHCSQGPFKVTIVVYNTFPIPLHKFEMSPDFDTSTKHITHMLFEIGID